MLTIPSSLAAFHDFEPELEDFEQSVLNGLAQTPKTLPCKFFYDEQGSALFDQICELEEYYPTRTEIALLQDYSAEIADLAGADCHIIEFGSGSSIKVRILLDALENPAAYTAIDISREHLLASAGNLTGQYPGIAITAICADYTTALEWPEQEASGSKPVGFFPGSTIGNFTPAEARDFLSQVAGMLRSRSGAFIVGVDLKKDKAVLDAAYDDKKGITALFNLNLLARANRELGTDFDLKNFKHRGFYNDLEGRVEMHLECITAHKVAISGKTFDFNAGERVHTENSYKYTVEEFQDIARKAGFTPQTTWVDSRSYFSLHYLQA
jgi:dimethylhistidine N-methyltransferase